MKRNESSNSLSNFVNYDFIQQKLKGLEEENLKLRCEVWNTDYFEIPEVIEVDWKLVHANAIDVVTPQANELTSETANYEEQEQELMMVCVEELSEYTIMYYSVILYIFVNVYDITVFLRGEVIGEWVNTVKTVCVRTMYSY